MLRDDLGAFGSPTSDSVRTMVTEETGWFLVVVFDFGGNEQLEGALGDMAELLVKFARGETECEWIQ